MIENLVKESITSGGDIYALIISNTKGMGITNPSIIKIKDDIFVNIRHVGYTLYHSEFKQKHQLPYGVLAYLNPEDDITLRTENYLCRLNKDYSIINSKKLDFSKFNEKPLWEFIGLEDGRLINWNNQLALTGVRRDTTTNGVGRMEISTIESNKEVDRKRIIPPKETYCEKNWMPIIDMPNHYVKWTIPTEIVKVCELSNKAETIKLVENSIDIPRDLRGGSQVISYKDYFVCITHEVDLWYNEQNNKDSHYYHRFVVWDKDWNIVKISDVFKFMDAKIEFACGLMFDNNKFHITFGFQDTTSYLLTISEDYFNNLLGFSDKNIVKKIDFNLDNPIYNYVFNSKKQKQNYELGLYYFNKNQYSSALSFFLRGAEIEDDKEITYECLLFVAKCISNVGRRKKSELSLWHNAIKFNPKRPEAYYFLSLYFEQEKKYNEMLSYAILGLMFCKNSKPINEALDYKHKYQLLFQECLGLFNCGQAEDSKIKFNELRTSNYPIDKKYKDLIEKNIMYISTRKNNILSYNKKDSKKLRYKFDGFKKIENNYSQTYQDIFVLSMLNGKTDGFYLEIGSADPFKGNNTYLLEKLGWKGLSLEINKIDYEKFKNNRKNNIDLADAVTYNYSDLPNEIDYLQVDCDPANVTYDVLTNLPFDRCVFKVITFEHDDYVSVNGKYRELSRIFLKSKGYELMCGNIAPNNIDCFEDWWIHPNYIDEDIINVMKRKKDCTINAKDYILNN